MARIIITYLLLKIQPSHISPSIFCVKNEWNSECQVILVRVQVLTLDEEDVMLSCVVIYNNTYNKHYSIMNTEAHQFQDKPFLADEN